MVLIEDAASKKVETEEDDPKLQEEKSHEAQTVVISDQDSNQGQSIIKTSETSTLTALSVETSTGETPVLTKESFALYVAGAIAVAAVILLSVFCCFKNRGSKRLEPSMKMEEIDQEMNKVEQKSELPTCDVGNLKRQLSRVVESSEPEESPKLYGS